MAEDQVEVLNENDVNSVELEEVKELFATLHDKMTTDPRDWAESPRDAFLYGVLVGWDDVDVEIARQHRWNPWGLANLRKLRKIVERVRNA